MEQGSFTISQLARRAGVSSKTLRYWERRGLLPPAQRTHTGYRVFPAGSLGYVAFIRRSKEIGLSLAEMRQALAITRSGRCPCAEVVRWSEARAAAVDAEIVRLRALRRRLHGRRRACGPKPAPAPCADVCSLTVDLPEVRHGRARRAAAARAAPHPNERRLQCATSGSASARLH